MMSRLTIDVSDQQHQRLKALAALEGKTIKQYALERLFPEGEKANQALDELKAVIRARVQAGLAGQVSRHSVQAILDEELGEDRD